MKKIILAALLMMGIHSFSNAQKITPAPAKPTTKNATEIKAAPESKMTKTTTVKVGAPAKTANAQGVVLKKDGTPDKRYNTVTAKSTVPVKKDGTPDKRFKVNKTN